MKAQAWQFFRLRPQNFPTRRIAGMVELLGKFVPDGFLDGFLKVFYGNPQDHTGIASELETMLTVNAKGFWKNRFRFDDAIQKDGQKKDNALIGKDRAREIVVNTIFPALYLYASESNDGTLRNSVQELFSSYPRLTDNSITRAMKNQLFRGTTQLPRVAMSACQQQGLILLHNAYCRPLRCTECLNLSNME